MSSHHVVRDQQEPAFLIADLNNSSFETIEQLLEWSPTILVLPTCLDEVTNWGINIDIIISKEDVLTSQEKMAPSIDIIVHSAETNGVTVALNYLIKNNYTAVNIVGDIMALYPIINQFSQSLQIVVHTSTSRCFYVNHRFQKWVITKTKFSLLFESSTASTAGLSSKDD